MKPIPTELHGRIFTTKEGLAAGLTPRMLRGSRFTRIHRGVYAVAGHELDLASRVRAAQLVLPSDAHLTHLSRIRALGLDWPGDDRIHFVVARDHHVTPDGVFLHRTEVLPPIDDVGVTPAAAFIALCGSEPLLDLVAIGDWLLHREHMTLGELVEVARAQTWRAGSRQAMLVSERLDGRSASVAESRLRLMFACAGLPRPEVNVPVVNDPNSPVGDQVFRRWRVVVEHEGGHHFSDADQIRRDVWRYSEMRRLGVDYVQVFAAMMYQPRAVVLKVHEALVSRGYEGPPPDFGEQWRSLFAKVRPTPRGPSAAEPLRAVS